LAAVITALAARVPAAAFVRCATLTLPQIRLAALTIISIVGLAYLLNYSGLTYTIGLGLASGGPVFVVGSPFPGWVAEVLSCGARRQRPLWQPAGWRGASTQSESDPAGGDQLLRRRAGQDGLAAESRNWNVPDTARRTRGPHPRTDVSAQPGADGPARRAGRGAAIPDS